MTETKQDIKEESFIDSSGMRPGESKNAYKARLKQEKLEREKAEKMAKKIIELSPQKDKNQKVDEDEEIDPATYFENRSHQIQQLIKAGKLNPYPHNFPASHSISQFINEFERKTTEKGEILEEIVKIGARMVNFRCSGKLLFFYTIIQEGKKLQIIANKANYHDTESSFETMTALFKRGDIVGVTGKPCRSNTGQLSILSVKLCLLSPCLHMLPKLQFGLVDQETRYRKRYLDLIINNRSREIFFTRSKIISFIRQYFDSRGFLEVETPMMTIIPGGAAARPFITYHNDLNMDIYMRIAPEIYLKKLIVGGLERVYEIGKQFRNEPIDGTHNPEFTSIELCQAYADYEDLMHMTENLLSSLVLEVTGSYKIQFHPEGQEFENNFYEIDFTPPFRRISMMEALSKKIGKPLPQNYETEEAREFFDQQVMKYKIDCPYPRSTPRLINKLVSHFLKVDCKNPTFLMEHPQIISPLAKYHRSKPNLTERFELFVNFNGLCNAFTELNDPFKQKEFFIQQIEQKNKGDDEAMIYDQEFCNCLEHALPPTGGWGMGIDRLAMLLTDNIFIQEVLLFPAMKPLENQRKSITY